MFPAGDKENLMMKPWAVVLMISLSALLPTGCRRQQAAAPVDHRRLTPNVTLHDVIMRSSSLNRDITYRVILPASLPQGKKLPVIYLLHGGGGSYRDWSNYSDIARYAEQGFLLVMPEGGNSYYTNSAEHPQERYEDYIVKDLIADVESRFPAISRRDSRAIIGVSMGGFGAVKIALKHPELYAFAAGLSSALDVPSRPFSIKRISQYRGHEQIFGAWGSTTRRENDPLVLIQTSDSKATPYMFLACGDREGLLAVNRKFANLLKQRRCRYEFHSVTGGNHDWNQWNGRMPALFKALNAHVDKAH
jgi:putative tributyrin esterase